MESLIWNLRVSSGYEFAVPLAFILAMVFIWFWDYPILTLVRMFEAFFPSSESSTEDDVPLGVLVVIPSLLRTRDELSSMLDTIASVAGNGYPGELTIVLTIDGTDDAPALYEELLASAPARCESFERVRLIVTGTPGRFGKPMAIEHGIKVVKGLVADGTLVEFPPIYVSTDADADLGPRAIEHLARRLRRRNRFTNAPARIVAGGLYVRGNSYWRGWKYFFSVEGQLTLQVAREYYVSNIGRHNLRWLPATGVPGALYATWSELFLAIPAFLGYTRSLRRKDWFRWWLGAPPPKFADSSAKPLPELMAGDTDDTVTAYLATLARYENGRFTLEPPATPIHAFVDLLRCLFVDRPVQYAPEAQVFTSSPSTIRSLFRQRKRWNSARVELAGRFRPALGYYWSIGFPVVLVLSLLARSLILGSISYLAVPAMFVIGSYPLPAFLGIYVGLLFVCSVTTLLSIAITQDIRYWRIALALPLAPLYNVVFNWIPGAIGIVSDVFFFGNKTGFAPEWTLRKGGSTRIALSFRIRRFFQLCFRSVVCGDVPFGAFWFGWGETKWTPSGFDGWTTGSRRSVVPESSKWFADVASDAETRNSATTRTGEGTRA